MSELIAALTAYYVVANRGLPVLRTQTGWIWDTFMNATDEERYAFGSLVFVVAGLFAWFRIT